MIDLDTAFHIKDALNRVIFHKASGRNDHASAWAGKSYAVTFMLVPVTQSCHQKDEDMRMGDKSNAVGTCHRA
jgi:hypothetical protein